MNIVGTIRNILSGLAVKLGLSSSTDVLNTDAEKSRYHAESTEFVYNKIERDVVDEIEYLVEEALSGMRIGRKSLIDVMESHDTSTRLYRKISNKLGTVEVKARRMFEVILSPTGVAVALFTAYEEPDGKPDHRYRVYNNRARLSYKFRFFVDDFGDLLPVRAQDREFTYDPADPIAVYRPKVIDQPLAAALPVKK